MVPLTTDEEEQGEGGLKGPGNHLTSYGWRSLERQAARAEQCQRVGPRADRES